MRQGYAQTLVSVTTRDTDDPSESSFSSPSPQVKHAPFHGAPSTSSPSSCPSSVPSTQLRFQRSPSRRGSARRSRHRNGGGASKPRLLRRESVSSNRIPAKRHLLFVHLDSGPKYELTFSGHRVFSPTELREASRRYRARRPNRTGRPHQFSTRRTAGTTPASASKQSLPQARSCFARFHIIEGQPLKIVSRQFPASPGGEPV